MKTYRVEQTITYIMEVEANSKQEAQQQFSTDECDDLKMGKIVATQVE